MAPSLKKLTGTRPKDLAKNLTKKLKDGDEAYFALTPDPMGKAPKIVFDKKKRISSEKESDAVYGTISRVGETFRLKKERGGKLTESLVTQLSRLVPSAEFEAVSDDPHPVTPDEIEAQLAAREHKSVWDREIAPSLDDLSLTPQQKKLPLAFDAAISGQAPDVDRAGKILAIMQSIVGEQRMAERAPAGPEEEPIYQEFNQAFPTDEMSDLVDAWRMNVKPYLRELSLTAVQKKALTAFKQLTAGPQADAKKAGKILEVFQVLVNEWRASSSGRAKTPGSEYAKTPAEVRGGVQASEYARTPAEVRGGVQASEYARTPAEVGMRPESAYGELPGSGTKAPAEPADAPEGPRRGPDGKTAADHAAEFVDVVKPQLKELLPWIAEKRGWAPGSAEFNRLVNLPGEIEAAAGLADADPKEIKKALVFFLNHIEMRKRDTGAA